MLEALLVRHCSPTLAGLKTGNLFTCAFPSHREMLASLLNWNRRLSVKGLHLLPLNQKSGRTTVYLYRPSFLARDLSRPETGALLGQLGYPCQCPQRCIAHLMVRLANGQQFPHEIGLFLGYPPEDVLGFMENRPNCKLTGCWKVYGDADTARLLFARFKECTRQYYHRLALGTPLEQLALPD